MNLVKAFRALVLTGLILYILYFFFPYVDEFIYDEDTLRLFTYTGTSAVFFFPTWYFYLWFAVWVSISVALLFFAPYSRIAFLLANIISVGLVPFSGIIIQSPISNTIGATMTLVDGAILGLAYFSSVSSHFEQDAT